MKYWTHSSNSTDLVVEMVECQECGILLPAANLELHVLHTHHGGGKHKHKQNNNGRPAHDEPPTDATTTSKSNNAVKEESTVDLMETIPCEDCHVLIPKHNWDIHRAHACPGRPLRQTPERSFPDKDTSAALSTAASNTDVLFPQVETVECDLCGILVPLANLDLHQAHACPAREGSTAFAWTQSAANSSEDDDIVVRSNNNNNYNHYNPRPLRMERWSCPQCSLLNSEQDVQCMACNYRLPGLSLQKTERKNTGGSRRRPTKKSPVTNNNGRSKERQAPAALSTTPPRRSTTKQKQRRQKRERDRARDEPFWNALPSWRTVVKTVVPDNYQHYLTTSSSSDDSDKEKGSSPLHSNAANDKSTSKKSLSSSKVVVPPQSQVRSQRTRYLDRLEQERQQYLLVLARTRREQEEQHDLIAILLVSAHEEQEQVPRGDEQSALAETSNDTRKIYSNDPSSTDRTADGTTTSSCKDNEEWPPTTVSTPTAAAEDCNEHNPPETHAPLPETPIDNNRDLTAETSSNHQLQEAQQHLELLQATEVLCLQHLEHLRRSRVVDELKLDICLLGLPQWRNHLEHLMILYQSCASEQHIDIIVWELRVHFMKYAMQEMMALLELAVRKYCNDGDDNARTGNKLRFGSSSCSRQSSTQLSHKVCVICQGVLPFLGKPLTPALRAL